MNTQEFMNKRDTAIRERNAGVKFKTPEEIDALCKEANKYISFNPEYINLNKAIESLIGLSQQLTKYILTGEKANKEAILEGVGDAYLALHLVKVILDLPDDNVDAAIEVKARNLDSLIRYYKTFIAMVGSEDK